MNNKEKDIQLSKSLSWFLRHAALSEGELSEEGYVSVLTLLTHKSFKKYNFGDVERVVNNNEKQRFKLRCNPSTKLWEIKANQGHSIQLITNIELIPILEPKYSTVIHGTYLLNWRMIKAQGLSRMRRKHIHFAKDPNVKSGIRKNVQVLIYIDLAKALKDGLKFYESENGVILTEGDANGYLKPEYFLKVIKIQCGQLGYPPYTRVEDIKYVFASYGEIKVKISKRHAIITFPDCEGTIDALALSKKVSVYGSFLTIKPYTDQPPQEKSRPLFARSKEKNLIIEPAKINLSGDFFQQLEQLLDTVRLNQEEVASISTLYLDLETALRSVWPGCRAVPFGSITTGLGIKSSDADCFVELPAVYRRTDGSYVNRAKKILQQYPDVFAEVYSIPQAHTPIVKFFHVPTETNCDVSFKTLLGARNSQLIAFLLHLDPRLVPVAVAIKYWAKVHGISGTGKLSNYALTMLFVFYLQQVSILPSIASLQRDCGDFVVDDWNTAFTDDRQSLPRSENTSSIADLFGGFFEYYANFNFEQLVVCPLMGHPMKKIDFADVDTLPQEMDRYKLNVTNNLIPPMKFTTPMCIQDPLELCHNVGSSVGYKLSVEITAYLRFAAAAYREDKSSDCLNFLKTILLQKPVIPNRRADTVFKTSVHSKELDKIVEDDWKKIVRNVIMILFEEICQAKLEKLPADLKPDAKKQAERYTFTLTKAIWKRKRFNKLYNHMEGTFLEKQIRISNDIINTDKEVHVLKMELGVCFLRDSRNVAVDIKYVEGDKSEFQEFGKMFLVMVKGWFFVLMKPFLTTPHLDNSNSTVITPSDEIRSCSEKINESVDSNLHSETELSMSIEQNCTISDA